MVDEKEPAMLRAFTALEGVNAAGQMELKHIKVNGHDSRWHCLQPAVMHNVCGEVALSLPCSQPCLEYQCD